jgi:hypothetical protein
MNRVCKYCGSDDLFSQGLVCKACRKKRRHDYYEKNKAQERKRNKEWFDAHPGARAEFNKKYKRNNGAKKKKQDQNSRLKREHGITLEQKQKMFDDQKGLCAVSGLPLTEGNYHLDHCHKTKRLRGLITKKINWAIGLFEDNPELLRAAANYLEKNNENTD